MQYTCLEKDSLGWFGEQKEMNYEEVKRKIISGGNGWSLSGRLIKAVARKCQKHNWSRTKYLIVIKTLAF